MAEKKTKEKKATYHLNLKKVLRSISIIWALTDELILDKVQMYLVKILNYDSSNLYIVNFTNNAQTDFKYYTKN